MESIHRNSLWSRNPYKVMGETGVYMYISSAEEILITYIELHCGRIIKIIQSLSMFIFAT